ncbi:NDR1/HIN1-like protein 1 [Arachis ipaensis]|uniref:NDR1/HIN1-like protein 1 n=1 Tax=Arachis ipaensis TaxID=130454 RepID=UPI0007AF2B67|nr:NDR1/HIN1-like protein 1 [Arachis ipaensis]
MSVKECDHHRKRRQVIIRRICGGILIFVFLVLLVILIIWAVLRPTKPTFILQDITVYAFNATVANFLTSNFQVTLTSRNPNDHIGVYYDHLAAYISYRNQQVTYRTAIPATYQGHKEVNVWSPFVYGTNIPIAPFNFQSLSQEENDVILVTLRVDGKVRWKVGVFVSGHYHIHVRCPAYINFGSQGNGVKVGPDGAMKWMMIQRCAVSV